MRWLPLFFYGLVCSTGILKFVLWYQVIDLWNRGAGVSDVLLHPHGMRYTLVLPIFMVSEWLNIPNDRVFAIVIPLLIAIITVCVLRTVAVLSGGLSRNNSKILFFIICLSFIFLSIFMNGRILFAITGSSILLYVFVAWDRKGFLGILIPVFLSFFLCSVSSGTFLVAVSSLCVFLLVKSVSLLRRQIRKCDAKNILLLTIFGIIFAIVFPLLKILAMKNIDYYGGGFEGVVSMLSHGLGAIFLTVEMSTLIYILVNIAVALLLLTSFAIQSKRLMTPMYFASVSMAGGAFGDSIMMMAIPPLVVLGCLSLLKCNDMIAIRPQIDA